MSGRLRLQLERLRRTLPAGNSHSQAAARMPRRASACAASSRLQLASTLGTLPGHAYCPVTRARTVSITRRGHSHKDTPGKQMDVAGE